MRNRTFETQFDMGCSFLNLLLSDHKPRNGNLDQVPLASLPELQKHYNLWSFVLTKVCQNLKEVVELPIKAYKDKKATGAVKNMQERMGEKKTLAGCYGKGYFGSSYFWLANELRRVAAHMASFYNLSINSEISATSLIKCTSVRKINIRIRSFWEIVCGNNLEFYDQWRILVCARASIFFEKSQGVRGILKAFAGFSPDPWKRSGGFSAGRQMQNCHGKIVTENPRILVYKLK